MPNVQTPRIPSYRRHKPSNQAVVTLNGRDYYLGKWKSAASKAEYDRVTKQWLAANWRLPTDPMSVTLAEVACAFRAHARTYYRDADGCVSRTVENFDEALKPLLKLYARTPAAEFDSLCLKVVRNEMIT